MVDNDDNNLTQEERELYDRQIRLWGLESQKRLREARILLIGVNEVGAEIIKNVILAGVQSVILLDDAVLNGERTIFVNEENIGQNRADASVAGAQALNPLVKVYYKKGSVNEIFETCVCDVDVVIATERTESDIILLNNTCRKHKVKFFACDVVGLFGFFMVDLLDHEYATESFIWKKGNVVDGTRTKAEKVSQMMRRMTSYQSLEKALDLGWTQENRAVSTLKKLDPSYFLIKVVLKFRDEYKRNPNSYQDDLKSISNICDDILSKIKYPKEKVETLLRSLSVDAASAAVSAVVGGVAAQDIIRTISQVDPPTNNFFTFNALSSLGTTFSLP